MKTVYLDYNATTPIDPRVLEVMQPYLTERFGNPASTLHFKGWEAKNAVDHARKQVAALLRCDPNEISFTAGSTESNNWALKGLVDYLLDQHPNEKIHVLSSNIEHASVREPLLYLQKRGLIEVDFLPVDAKGYISLDQLERARKPHSKILSLIWVHNELGTIQKMKEIAGWCEKNNLYLHTDATQAVGKIDINLFELPISLLSFSAHKLYGPKGIGLLFTRQKNPKVLLSPLLHGGSQEKHGRSGTLNVPGIVGLGKACEIAQLEMLADWERVSILAADFFSSLKRVFPQLRLNGAEIKERSPYNLSLTFPGVQSFQLLPKIQNLCVSAGSACSSDNFQGNPILLAIGHKPDEPATTLRLSLGRFTKTEDVHEALETLSKALKTLGFGDLASAAGKQ